jgi:predicted metal-dependent peptidase
MNPLLKRLQQARTTLLLDQPFFGVLALRLTLRQDDTCDTAYTDGNVIAFSSKFADTLSQDELVAVLAHEVMHCACGHPWRRDARDPQRWNVAADYAINALLRDAHFKLPDSALLDPQYDGKYSEWIYDRLPPNPPHNSDNGNDPSGMGEVRDAPATSDATEADWQQATKQAAEVAKAQGKLPGALKRELDKLTDSRVDWRSLLRRYVQDIARSDYSWSRPNTRYLVSGLFLPALHSIECGRIAVAIDTSGSIDQVLLAQFAAEVQAIAHELQPARVDVIYCDTEVNRVDSFERSEPVTIAATGGGGTDFRPVFDRIDQDGDVPAVLIYLTDLYGTFPDSAPEYPVIWAVSNSNATEVPFGEYVPCNG